MMRHLLPIVLRVWLACDPDLMYVDLVAMQIKVAYKVYRQIDHEEAKAARSSSGSSCSQVSGSGLFSGSDSSSYSGSHEEEEVRFSLWEAERRMHNAVTLRPLARTRMFSHESRIKVVKSAVCACAQEEEEEEEEEEEVSEKNVLLPTRT